MAHPVHPTSDIVRRVRALVDNTSIAEVARRLQLAEATVARLAGGLKVTQGTALLAAQRLQELEAA